MFNTHERVLMLKENQKIEMKWSTSNKNWYIEKGYHFTNMGEIFYVDANDLSTGSHQKVKIICDYCNKEINSIWRDYLHSINNHTKFACKKCRQKRTSEEDLIRRREYLYSGALKVCKENNLTIITPIDDIKSADDRITYNCPKHGNNETKIYTLLLGHVCPKCKIDNQKLTPDEVEKRIKDYGTIILNKEEYIDTRTKNLRIVCRECGNEFTTSYNSFVCSNGGQYCPDCSKYESHGEKAVRNYLEENKIYYIPQYKFDDCKDKNALPFDFYLPNENKIIEYDGAQHYTPTSWNGMSKSDADKCFAYVQNHDKIKNQYCIDNNIKLLRVPYWNYNDIESILEKFIYS